MAKNMLRKLKPDEYFYIHEDGVVKKFKDLPKALRSMNNDLFRYHLNAETNDFANWIRFLSDDQDFITKVEKCYKKRELLKLFEDKLDSLNMVRTAVKKAKKVKLLELKKPEVPKEKAIAISKKKVIKKKAGRQKKIKEPKKLKPGDYLTTGIREYLLGVITGLILGLIIASLL